MSETSEERHAMIQSPRRGFFASLYDVSFRTFVTPAIIEVVYIIALVIVAIWSIAFLVSGFTPSYFVGAQPSAGSILLHIILTPIIFVLGSLAVRINLEFIMAVFRVAEKTAALREAQNVSL